MREKEGGMALLHTGRDNVLADLPSSAHQRILLFPILSHSTEQQYSPGQFVCVVTQELGIQACPLSLALSVDL